MTVPWNGLRLITRHGMNRTRYDWPSRDALATESLPAVSRVRRWASRRRTEQHSPCRASAANNMTCALPLRLRHRAALNSLWNKLRLILGPVRTEHKFASRDAVNGLSLGTYQISARAGANSTPVLRAQLLRFLSFVRRSSYMTCHIKSLFSVEMMFSVSYH